MLSRSNSNAGDRLRRAKSTSSAHTSSSGHHRTSTSIDPFVTRLQAETAALEAYQRAQQQQELPDHLPYRPVPPRPQRRKSQLSGRIEGSHLEDAKLGRRRSTSKKGTSSDAISSRARSSRQSTEASDMYHQRAMIPPSVISSYHAEDITCLEPPDRYIRKSRSSYGYTDGSPVPRNTLNGSSSTQAHQAHALGMFDHRSYDANQSTPGDFSVSETVTKDNEQRPTQQIRGTQTDDKAVAEARDQCLRDFQQKKLRERKSIILAPFQWRRATNAQKRSESGYDTSLPPFNFAADGIAPPSPPPLEIPSMQTVTLHTEQKSRNFSDSLKGRLKKVFRKSSRVPMGLPAQHVEGRHFHFSTTSPASRVVDPGIQEDPFTTTTDYTRLAVPGADKFGATAARSDDGQSTTKSRVTSWTNSTVPDTTNTRTGHEQGGTADEHGRLRRSDSISTLRKASSFFGNPIKARLRRPSKPALQSSDESTALYSALQDRMHVLEPSTIEPDTAMDSQSENLSALETLPSQQRPPSTASAKQLCAVPTIRSVTPDPGAYKLDIPSPVTEVLSPDGQNDALQHSDEHSEPTPGSRLQRRRAIKAPTPSKEQIARRIERSKNRWQSPLDELSPTNRMSSMRYARDDNPYELRSLSKTLQQPIADSGLPHHAKLCDQTKTARQDVLSPSVYSRGTDGASPRSDTPVDEGGMIVTITGREVKSYSISPAKKDETKERPIRTSHDWRRWLSNEINAWDIPKMPDEFALPETALEDAMLDRKDDARQHEPGERSSAAPPVLEFPPLQNYIHRSRTYTEQSNSGNASGTVGLTEDDAATPAFATESGNAYALSSPTTTIMNDTESRVSSKTKFGYKAKSAFDLRASYKSKNTGATKPIEVRRKAINNNNIFILEDKTIRNISAGPYAASASSITTGGVNKENTNPPDANGLPTLSSSEWLAAGTGKKRDANRVSSVHPAQRDMSVSRGSRSRTASPNVTGGSSPAQRMVTSWLEGKRSKENSPALI